MLGPNAVALGLLFRSSSNLSSCIIPDGPLSDVLMTRVWAPKVCFRCLRTTHLEPPIDIRNCSPHFNPRQGFRRRPEAGCP
jgi:hypothetical protein